MAIDISCPKCGKGYTLADKQLGKTVACRDCDEAFVVEDEADRRSRPSQSEEDRPRRRDRDDREDDRDPDRPRRRERDEYDDDRPRRERDRYEDDRPRRRERDDYDEPRPRRRKSSGGGMLIWGLVGGGVGLMLLFGVVILIVVLASGGFNRVSRANFNRIQPGMTVAEVEGILGAGKDEAHRGPQFGGNFRILSWEGRKCKIVVFFSNDRMFTKSFFDTEPVDRRFPR